MAGRLEVDDEIDLDSLDIRALRLSILVKWGHNPQWIMESAPPGWRQFLFACADKHMLDEQLEAKAMDPNAKNKRGPRPKREDFIIPDPPSSRKPFPPPPPPDLEPLEVGPDALEPRRRPNVSFTRGKVRRS